MNPNPGNKSDNEKEAEIAANRLIDMMEQQALYARIAKINEETKRSTPKEGGGGESPLVIVKKPSKKAYLKWVGLAASLIIGGLFFLSRPSTPPVPQFALEDTAFRGTEYTESRSVINGEIIRNDYANLDDLIDKGNFEEASELLKKLDKEEETVGNIYRKGIIAYLTNDFVTAANAFQQIVESEDIEYIENAYWNLLLAHKNTGVLSKAKEVAIEMQSSKYITDKQKKAALKETD